MISEERIAEVRQSARISEFVTPHVSLKRRGRSLVGLCPFHNEKTASFSVDDERGFFHCFGCSAGGNVFKFLMLIENLTFPEAVRKVAAHYGITIPEEGAHVSGIRDALFEATASTARYFRRCLMETPVGKPMLEYLADRGIHAEASERFVIGAAPDSGDGLVRWFRKEGIDVKLGLKVGLLGERNGRVYDRFRGRLMFPIRDAQGRVIGFGGRMLGDGDGPKYLNSPESELYHKSRALYGLYEARDALRNEAALILVEGYFDVIALHQAGFRNAVATCGTALTAEQSRIMRRHATDVVTLFDGDAAGDSAAARSFPIFIEAGLWPRGAVLPQGEDPDTFVRSRGVDALREAIACAVPLAEAYVRYLVKGAPAGETGMARAGAELAALLAKVDDPFAHDLLVRKAALWTGISEDVLRRQGRVAAVGRPGSAPKTPPVPRRMRASSGPEEQLVVLLLSDAQLGERADESNVVAEMEDPVWKSVADGIIRRIREGKSVDVGDVLDGLADASRSRLSEKLIESELNDVAVRNRIFEDCMHKISERARRRHNASVLAELRKREQLGIDLTPADELARLKPRGRSDA